MSHEQTFDTEPQPEPWLEEEPTELPRRPRTRLLGAGGSPLVLTLLAVLLIACGFIAGALVEKGQSSSTSSSSSARLAGLASRFAALRAGASGGSSSAAGTGSTEASSGGVPGGLARAGAGATVGEVAYISGHTLYVNDTEGNTVKVIASPTSAITKTVKSSVAAIHPGETVLVTGSTAGDGAVAAQSIRVGSLGGAGLGAGLFGSGGGRAAHTGGSNGGGGGGGNSSSSSEPALFGNGG
jgi:hypothetical protein